MSREGVCIHGALRRQCETCDLADQLEKMTKERDSWKRLADAWHRHSLRLLVRDFDRKNEIVVAAEAALREMGVELR